MCTKFKVNLSIASFLKVNGLKGCQILKKICNMNEKNKSKQKLIKRNS